MKRKIIGIAVLLAVVIVGVMTFIGNNKTKAETVTGASAPSGNTVTITGVIGSEKKAFFDDPRVQAVFAENGLDVKVETAGSRDIANTDLSKYDFAFPSSAPAAQKISDKVKPRQSYSPFYSPMAIASYKPVMDLLAKNGVASQNAQGMWHINMDAYLKLVSDGKKWKDLDGAAALYNSPRSILINSTDIRKSNSAAMYLALTSYTLNGGSPVSTDAQADKILPVASKLFLSQGYSESSSDDPFQNYLSQGMGAVPMVMIYESQFVGEAINDPKRLTDQMVLAYPDPTVFSKHTLIPITDKANKLGELLTTNPKLIELTADYGFRPTNDGTVFNKATTDNKVTVEKDLINIADVPSYEMLENMLTKISNLYASQGK
jgi:hypothetical protein